MINWIIDNHHKQKNEKKTWEEIDMEKKLFFGPRNNSTLMDYLNDATDGYFHFFSLFVFFSEIRGLGLK